VFYTSLASDEEPFVAIGDFCGSDTVVGIIESSRIFYQIPAGHCGIITEVCALNATSVAVGDPLFKLVRPQKADALRARERW
jgi:biotin carboxyl carrier protein